MPNTSQGKIDGDFFSWAELETTIGIINGPKFSTEDIAKFNWSDKVEPGTVRGAGPRKRGTTVGMYDASAEIALYIDAAGELQKSLATVNSRITLVRFNISGMWAPLSGSGKLRKVLAKGCRIIERSSDNAPGADATLVTFPLNVTELEVDGIKLV